MSKVNISLKIEEDTRHKIDHIAKGLDRGRSYIINQALDNYISLYDGQLQRINSSLEEADKEQFANDKEINALLKL